MENLKFVMKWHPEIPRILSFGILVTFTMMLFAQGKNISGTVCDNWCQCVGQRYYQWYDYRF